MRRSLCDEGSNYRSNQSPAQRSGEGIIMGYNECIEAAGVPVLSYHEDGSYSGFWFAYTAAGFYQGSYGSCSGCDWRESECMYNSTEEQAKAIDAGIGREILKAKPLSLDEFIKSIEDAYVDDKQA